MMLRSRSFSPFLLLLLSIASVFFSAPGAHAWSKEGHIMTCRIAQVPVKEEYFFFYENLGHISHIGKSLLDPAAAEVVHHLLPEYANGDLSSLCTWPDQIRHWYKYRWSSPLHFIDTPDDACTFDYARDCHDPHGKENMCVAGAVQNYTSQLMHYKEGSSDRRCKEAGPYNMTEALIFLSHFMGDIHQPMHCGFTSDEGGNTINIRWYRHKSNLHHVWDREIILTAEKEFYDNDLDSFQEDIQNNFTDGAWSDDLSSWTACDDLLTCPTKWGEESINLACKWGYKGVTAGETLAEDYFYSRFPILTKRIAQGGVRLSMILNKVFGHQAHSGHRHHRDEVLAIT